MKHIKKIDNLEHPAMNKLSRKRKNKTRNLAIIVILVLIVFGIYYFTYTDTTSSKLNFEIPNGPIHWHPHLTIKIDGKEQIIPANIGIGVIHSPLHTHEMDGIIHMEIERPTKQNVVLGYFFNVWGRTFNKNCIFEYCTDKGTLKMYVNGKENLEFENYFMHDNDKILIEYNSIDKLKNG